MLFSLAAVVDVNTFGDGTAILTCSAEGVINMQWSVSYFGIIQNIDLETILASATEGFKVRDGITLSSTANFGNIMSTMSVSRSGGGVQSTQVTFVCFGRTQSGGNFRHVNTIIASLANSTTPTQEPDSGPPLTGKLQPVSLLLLAISEYRVLLNSTP